MKKRFNLKKEYIEAWNYLRESRKFIWIICGLFLFSSLIGFFISPPEAVLNQIIVFISDLLDKTSGMSSLELINFIFFNNLKSGFFGMVFGIFFGIFPIIYTLINGYVLGFVASMSVQSSGILSLWRLFPHGIFELPAIIVSFGLGLRIGASVFNKNQKIFLERLKKSIKVFVLFIVPLLIFAAVIEGILISLS